MVFCCIVLLYTVAPRFGGLIVYHAFRSDDSLPCGLSFIMPRIQWTIVPQRIIPLPSGIHCSCKVNKISSISLHLRREMVDMAVKNTAQHPKFRPRQPIRAYSRESSSYTMQTEKTNIRCWILASFYISM